VARDGAEAAGFDHYLSKPIDFKRLEVLVEQLTSSGRPKKNLVGLPGRRNGAKTEE
jgi:hypothetical protein